MGSILTVKDLLGGIIQFLSLCPDSIPSKKTWKMKKSELLPLNKYQSWPEIIKLFSCSTQLSMKYFPLINVKMQTIVGILTGMRAKNTILGLNEPKKAEILVIFILMSI